VPPSPGASCRRRDAPTGRSAEDERPALGDQILLLPVETDVQRLVPVVLDLGAALTFEVLELTVGLLGLDVLETDREAILPFEQRPIVHVAELRSPAVGVLVDDGERQWVIEVLVAELREHSMS
jgi:hypothetical protein